MPAARRREPAAPARRREPAARKTPMLARGFVYTLLLVVCTVTAAYGGYVVGTRHQPEAAPTPNAQIGEAPKQDAVAKAVAAQKATDRAKRRQALIDFAKFQRERFATELSRKLNAQRISAGEEAARAYARGRKAGSVAGFNRGAKKALEQYESGTAPSATAATADAGPDAVPTVTTP